MAHFNPTNDSRDDLDEFRLIVAFAKLGPLLRLEQNIREWKHKGGIIEAIFGIDAKGTSQQALEFALENFHKVYIVRVSDSAFNLTFHPKIYLFVGQSKAVAYVGSNNLTVGGTETNPETHIKIELELPDDMPLLVDLRSCWDDALQISVELDPDLLVELIDNGWLLDESRRVRRQPADNIERRKPQPKFPKLKTIPPSPVPERRLREQVKRERRTIPDEKVLTKPTHVVVQALVIQITPHGNGEVFLSKKAVDQNHEFFCWPFTGQTIPKKVSNPAYPQRVPDPVVNITVFDEKGAVIVTFTNFNLNTVYYAPKSEIRITVPQEVVKATPNYSVMVMRQVTSNQPYDYDLEIYTPGSEQYDAYLSVCNQQMPSGGRPIGRKFGWL